MATTLKISNFDGGNIAEKSYLASDYTTGTTITLKSAQNFLANLYALVGSLSEEQTELRLITGVASNVVTLQSGLTNSHAAYSEVTALNFNQIRIYRAINVNGTQPADISFTVLDTVAIDPDESTTTYLDSDGGSGFWYKYTYVNEATSDETDLADSQGRRGGSAGHYVSLDEIRNEAGFGANVFVNDVTINEAREEAEDSVNSKLYGSYDVPFEEPVPPQITRIVKQLAAAYLLKTDYGPFASGTSKDGDAKEANAMKELNDLKTQASPLLDADGNSQLVGKNVRGWPNDSTATADPVDAGGDRLFRISDVY